MIDLSKLLFIEPKNKHREEPIIDSLTRKMTYALRHAEYYDHCLGHHTDICGCESCPMIHLQNGMITNELAVHYLAFHRDEVPQKQLEIVSSFKKESVPILYELWPNRKVILMTKEEEVIYEKTRNRFFRITKQRFDKQFRNWKKIR